MAQFGDALQGYLAGQEIAARQPTPVQSFLAQLRESQQQKAAEKNAEGLMAFRQGMLGNTADRTAAMLLHYQDQADYNAKRADLSERRLQAKQAYDDEQLKLRKLVAEAQAGNQNARAALAKEQANLASVTADLKEAFGADEAQSIINKNNAMANLTGAKTGQVGEPTYSDVQKQYQTDLKAWMATPPNKRGAQPTPQDAYQKLIQAKPTADTDTSTAPGGMASLQPTDMGLDLGTAPNPLMAMLKAKPMTKTGIPAKTSTQPTPLTGKIPTYPSKPDTTPNYIQSAEPPSTGYQAPMDDTKQVASMDPLHGQYSQRDPGVYEMNGKQYLVDGTGMIQALNA